MAEGTELKAAEKKQPQAVETFMTKVEATDVMKKAKNVGRRRASQ